MAMTDAEVLEHYTKMAKLLPDIYSSDVAVTITDTEKHVFMQQAKTFHMNVNVGDAIREGGGIQKAIQTRTTIVARVPAEMYGFPVVTHTVPLVNEETRKLVGGMSVAVSLERETVVMNVANELLGYAKSMEGASGNLAGASEELASSSQGMSDRIGSVTDEIKKMDDIIGYIKSVSETSNLLGLNAAIEAARAGEAGRGFAVVAEEIRKLASSSQESSVEILNTLNALRADVNRLIEGVQSFATISKEQETQASSIAADSHQLSDLSEKLKKLAEELV